MKYKYIVFVVALLLILIFMAIRLFNHSIDVVVSDIKHMRFHYTKGYAMNADVSYEIDCDNGECILTYKPYGIDMESAKKKKLDSETVKKIENILTKYEVARWDGFNKNAKNVLDGDSFSFSLTMKDDSNISASGYMKWPENYGNVRSELDAIFEKLFDK